MPGSIQNMSSTQQSNRQIPSSEKGKKVHDFHNIDQKNLLWTYNEVSEKVAVSVKTEITEKLLGTI